MEKEIENELERLGLDPSDRGRYWLIHCPQHDDRNKSAQCFKDGWIHCHAGCPRVHINSIAGRSICRRENYEKTEPAKEFGDFTELWMELEPITEDVKGVPAAFLRKLGWKKYPGSDQCPSGVFIPYFNVGRTRVVCYQIRHDLPHRRFTFPSNCSLCCYGLEVLRTPHKYICATEGSRDSAILRMANVPAVALPAASSTRQLRGLCDYCKQNGRILVWCGDKDDAGERLQSNISIPYIDARVSVGKDVGELYAAKGIEGVKKEYEKYQLRTDTVQQGVEDPQKETQSPAEQNSQQQSKVVI